MAKKMVGNYGIVMTKCLPRSERKRSAHIHRRRKQGGQGDHAPPRISDQGGLPHVEIRGARMCIVAEIQ